MEADSKSLFKEPDYNTVQFLYGFVLIALAVIMTVFMPGNVYVLTGAVALLLIKDGLPNLVIGIVKFMAMPNKEVKI